jgi:hypothetical protein
MSEQKYTPGPWSLLEVEGKLCPAGAGNLSLLTIVEEDGTNFAAIYHPADARLIVAAPDLLEALELVRSIIVAGAAVGFNPLDGGDWAERLYRSQSSTAAAVKKAGGNIRSSTP